ncbi:UbiA prenyltransferase family-domain-containing protein [Mycena belliarum]|uniref:UbiA prenyltransferase family-domain-containing protein n=1 Tax=Mycena belliarum TaxID=1033014 RepID=A0AAD6U8V5_9AGAR|nr:UbiA prenyltransferase family-domain-containing protein [Mycena belliae]
MSSILKPPSVMKSLRDAAYTTYLFNQCDIVSTLCPVIAVGTVLAGVPSMKAFFQGLVWQQLHLIAFEIQNQITGLEEDKLSKPNRPLVTGRLTIPTAQNIYIALVILSLWNSAEHGLLACSIFHLVSMVAYNEAALAQYWIFKSFIGALGYVAYCWGVTVIYDDGRPLSQTSVIAVIMSGLIFTTTVISDDLLFFFCGLISYPLLQGHAQDFRDRDGDAAMGRKTLAIVLPQPFARWSLMVLMFAWTAGLVFFWGPPVAFSVAFAGLAALTTIKFVVDYSQEADRNSYWWYNIWLIAAHIMPLFKQIT